MIDPKTAIADIDAVLAHKVLYGGTAGAMEEQRLHRRYFRLTSRGKPSQVAIVAIAREICVPCRHLICRVMQPEGRVERPSAECLGSRFASMIDFWSRCTRRSNDFCKVMRPPDRTRLPQRRVLWLGRGNLFVEDGAALAA